MRDVTRRFLAGLLAIALVSTAAAPVGTASASHDCSFSHPLVVVVEDLAKNFVEGDDCNIFHGSTEVDPAEYQEAQQVHSELYSQALGQASQQEVLGTAFSNYLQDTTTIAKLEGKNRFIRSLENGSSQAQAIADSREATLDYYASRQATLLKSFESQVMSLDRIHNSASSEQNLSAGDVMLVNSTDPGGGGRRGDGIASFSIQNESVQLVNGSSRTVMTAHGQTIGGTAWDVTPDTGGTLANDRPYLWVAITAPSSEASGGSTPIKMLNGSKWTSLWSDIDSQGVQQANEVEDFANSTYDQWDAGLINSSDLVDPYLGAREYSPSGGSEWSERTLSALGILPPEEAEDLRSMQIVDETTGITYEGTLMSDGNPTNASGFTVGETYNATQITGKQFVATANGPERLTGEFTIANASGFEDGPSFGQGDVIHYSNPDYQTADLQEFKNLSRQIQQIRADLEARERKIEAEASGGGGGLFDFDGLGASLPFGGAGIVVVIGAIVVLGLVTRN